MSESNNWAGNPATSSLQREKPQPQPEPHVGGVCYTSQGLLWGHRRKWTNHSYSCPLKKKKQTRNSSPLSPRADWLSHCRDQFPKKQHVVHRFCFGSDSQRTGNHVWGLGKVGLKQQLTWLWHVLLHLMGSTTMGFYSLQNPLPETKTSEMWDNVKPLTFKP